MGAQTEPVPCGEGTWVSQHLASQAFGPLLARELNAQFLLASVSGMGVFRNWNSDGPVMRASYPFLSTSYDTVGTSWDFSRYPADLVILSLGTNDFSDGAGPEPRKPLPADRFIEAYTALLQQIARAHPRARIMCTSSPMLDKEKNDKLEAYVREAFTRFSAVNSTTQLHFFRFEGQYNAGCTGHPDAKEHQQIAAELKPSVAAFMNW
jgi:lysophospholipase L1-like esterase